MSYTDEIKNEILSVRPKKSCCRECELCGMVLFLSKSGGEYTSRNLEVMKNFRSLIKKVYGFSPEIEQRGAKFCVGLPCEISQKCDGGDINRAQFVCEGCIGSFLRGVFLAVGSCSDPRKEYNLSFNVCDERLSYELCRLLIDSGFDAKTRENVRGGTRRYIIYIKKSAAIEDFLTLIGAQSATLDLMELKVEKDVRSNINRTTNFETANIKKSSVSCAVQLDAINKLEASGKLRLLPDDLLELANARRDNIDMSLSELGEMFGLSRSGIHHRLQKIIDAAGDIE